MLQVPSGVEVAAAPKPLRWEEKHKGSQGSWPDPDWDS